MQREPLTFYYGSGSPFAWRVWLALEHKQIPYQANRLSFDAGDLQAAAYTAINPRQQVPAIVDNGFALYESAAIVDYLEDQYPQSGAPLWPQEVRARAVARRIATEVDLYVVPPIDTLITQTLGGRQAPPDVELLATSRQTLARELALIEQSMAGRFIVGSTVSAADFTLYPLVAFLRRIDIKRPGYDMSRLISARLQLWMTAVESLSYFDKTYPPHWRE